MQTTQIAQIFKANLDLHVLKCVQVDGLPFEVDCRLRNAVNFVDESFANNW